MENVNSVDIINNLLNVMFVCKVIMKFKIKITVFNVYNVHKGVWIAKIIITVLHVNFLDIWMEIINVYVLRDMLIIYMNVILVLSFVRNVIISIGVHNVSRDIVMIDMVNVEYKYNKII